jgi:hypothetical protein
MRRAAKKREIPLYVHPPLPSTALPSPAPRTTATKNAKLFCAQPYKRLIHRRACQTVHGDGCWAEEYINLRINMN